MLLAHTSWKGLTFYKCKGQLPSTVEYYNQIPSRSASLWILQLVSPPGLRCFQQQNHRRRLLNISVLYLLTIDSDAALVSSTFQITHSSILSLDGFFPSDYFENSDFSVAARILPAPSLRMRNTTPKRPKKVTLEEYSFMSNLLTCEHHRLPIDAGTAEKAPMLISLLIGEQYFAKRAACGARF